MVTPFRAGRLPGEAPAAGAPLARMTAGPSVLLADISEFQPDLADAAYLAWSPAVIFRAMYGTTVDRAWYGGGRRSGLHAGGARFTGIYQYLVAGQDPLAQADALGNLLGTLQPGEKIIADIEEGAGSQQGRWVTWADRIAQLGDDPWSYSGLNFAASAGLEPVDWVAAYGGPEPSPPHRLWQFTSAYRVPGLPSPVDCSVFHGPVAKLAALAYAGGAPVPPPAQPAPAFPWPAADYIGAESADAHCHSGFSAADRPHVLAWQQQMSRRGWRIPVTGRYDTASQSACRAFQAEKGLAADGKAGPLTWAAAWTAPVT